MTIELPDAPNRSPLGSFHAFDTSDLRRSFVLDCNSGMQFQLSELAHRVLTATWSGTSFEDVAIACSNAERRLTADDVRRLYERVMTKIDLAERRRCAPWSDYGLLLRFTLIPSVLVSRIGAPFASLFQPLLAVPAILAILYAAAYWITVGRVAWSSPTVSDTLAGYGLFLASCLAHELGHAGACIRFGVRPGPIGVALYLVFPAFFSDVTRVWRLKRWQRVAVDAAGLYVQCLCCAVCVLIWAYTHAGAPFVAITLIVASALLDLNPLFRFDGYWVVSDALGVRDLHKQVGVTIRRLVWRLTGLEDVAAPSWPRSTTAAVALYSFATVGAWVWFAGRLLAGVHSQGRWALAMIPRLGTHGQAQWIELADRLGTMLVGCFALAYCLMILLRFTRKGMSGADGRSDGVET